MKIFYMVVVLLAVVGDASGALRTCGKIFISFCIYVYAQYPCYIHSDHL